MTNIPNFYEALAAPNATPHTVFDALRAYTQAVMGAKLFTIMTYNEADGGSARVYSNMPNEYPVSGTKPMNPTHWSKVVIEDKQDFIANDYEGVKAVFYDHELIRSLGCESVINITIVINGEVYGTLNCLDVAGFYTPEKIEAAQSLKLAGAAALLFFANSISKEASNGC